MTHSDVVYRRASVYDLYVVDALARGLHVLHHAMWPGVFAAAGAAGRDHAHWRAAIGAPGCAAFIAECNAAAAGFVTVALAEESGSFMQPMRFARINSICVAEPVRRIGIGRGLMACAENWARGQGAVDVRLMVFNFNAGALRLYEELGYVARSTAMGKSLVPPGVAGPDDASALSHEGTSS